MIEKGCYWCKFRKSLFCTAFHNNKKTHLKEYGVYVSTIESLKNNPLNNKPHGYRCWSFEERESKTEQVQFT